MADVFANAGIEAAKIAGDSIEMDIAADEIEALVKANSAGHGGFGQTVHTAKVPGKRGVKDRVVYSDHPAAFPIEHGHAIVTKSGRTVGYVAGIHAFRDALNQIREVDGD